VDTTFARLTLLVMAGLLGPLLAAGNRPLAPMVVGELAAGAILGRTGFDVLNVNAQPFPFMFSMGFAMLMLTAGTHVDFASPGFRQGIARGWLAQVVVIAAAIPLGWGIDATFGVGQPTLLAVLLAGSSAAVVFPIIEERRLKGSHILLLTSWIALADATTVLVMPLTLVGAGAIPKALGGDVAIIALAIAALVLAERVRPRPLALTLRRRSRKRGWGLQVRLAILLLVGLAAVAERTGGSSLVAGFAAGAVMARLREPGRLAKQISGLANGFFVPAFLVLLGATLNLRGLATSPSAAALALTMAGTVILIHLAGAFVGSRTDRLALGLSASGQLGLPAAAASLGLASGAISPTVAAAIVGAGCLTLVAAAIGSALLASETPPPSPTPGTPTTADGSAVQSAPQATVPVAPKTA
jgi:Kef-type K+ transport system membrane component KefB